ncbi:MAG: hypothetical protein FWH15_05740 [Betaproteobacteria bacterium]|nr:hypothetical protein [Betaproteobacteria bacterium]
MSHRASKGFSGRPRSLKTVLADGLAHGDVDAFLREFLDEFYMEQDCQKRESMLIDEPQLCDNDRHNAYLAAVAEHLALRYRLNAPDWVRSPARFLKQPFFPCGLESLKAVLLMESPVAFRRRMIFVAANPLYRPRKDVPVFGMSFGAERAGS